MIAFCRKGFLLLVLSILSAAGADTGAPSQPPPRPQINQRAAHLLAAPNLGIAAVDAKWRNYGVYLQQMIETVQKQWDALLSGAKDFPSSGTNVTVKFKLNSTGFVSKIVSVKSSSATKNAEGYCVAAITKPSPYSKWTDDMVANLGKEQEMTFLFYYQ